MTNLEKKIILDFLNALIDFVYALQYQPNEINKLEETIKKLKSIL